MRKFIEKNRTANLTNSNSEHKEIPVSYWSEGRGEQNGLLNKSKSAFNFEVIKGPQKY
jgi:hypothetical protein